MSRNKLFKNTLIYSFGNILPKAASFILLPIYLKYLSPADYGIIASMSIFQALIVIAFTLCFDRAVFRLYWDYKTEKDQKDFFGTLIISIVVISIISSTLLFAFNKYVELVYKSIEFYPFFAITILSVFFGSFSLVPKNYLILKERANVFVILSLTQFAFNAGFILWFVVFKQEGPIGYLKGNLFSSLILFPVYLKISYRIINLKFKYRIFLNILSFSLPLIPAIITSWLLNMSDRIFIERYFDIGKVGIYSLGYQLAGLVLLISGAISVAYEPLYFRLANSENQISAKKKIFEYNNILLILVVVICFAISFFSKEVITILFDEKYKEAYYFVMMISFSYLFSQADGLSAKGFVQSKKMKENMYISMLIATLNVILNFLLIPPLGVFGAAYATIASMAIGFFISYAYVKKYCYFIPFNWKFIIPITSFLILLVVFFQFILNLNVIASLIIKSLLLSFISFIIIKKYYSQIKFAIYGK